MFHYVPSSWFISHSTTTAPLSAANDTPSRSEPSGESYDSRALDSAVRGGDGWRRLVPVWRVCCMQLNKWTPGCNPHWPCQNSRLLNVSRNGLEETWFVINKMAVVCVTSQDNNNPWFVACFLVHAEATKSWLRIAKKLFLHNVLKRKKSVEDWNSGLLWNYEVTCVCVKWWREVFQSDHITVGFLDVNVNIKKQHVVAEVQLGVNQTRNIMKESSQNRFWSAECEWA